MFASIELGRRIEAAEARMMVAIAERARAQGPADAVVVEPLDGGVATFVRPDAPMNKVIGIGFDGALDDERLAAVERAFAVRRAPLQVELATLASHEAAQQFARRGYRLQAFENVLGCAPAAFRAPASALRVEVADEGSVEPWLACMADSFLAGDGSGAGSPDAFARAEIVRSMQEMRHVPGMRRYVVHQDGVIAGGASMRLDGDGVAQLCGAATAPPFRRRGVQSALLAARLRDAATAGCDVAVITTQPGSKSQQNAHRQGFALLYARAVLVRPPA
jgi:ribosomal protein S18 acetylase RimI-like enzyme